MKYKITIEVTYDSTSVKNQDELEQALEREVERVVGNGFLSPSGGEIVDDWDFEVTSP